MAISSVHLNIAEIGNREFEVGRSNLQQGELLFPFTFRCGRNQVILNMRMYSGKRGREREKERKAVEAVAQSESYFTT